MTTPSNPSALYRILSDPPGSPRAVVDASRGSVLETISYDEFGNETDTLAPSLPSGSMRIPFGFARELYDPDTGLVRFGARDYAAGWSSLVGHFFADFLLHFQYGGDLGYSHPDLTSVLHCKPRPDVTCN